METKVSLIMVADDRLFIAQAEKAGDKAGKLAGERVGRATKRSSDQILNNWELPIAQTITDSNELERKRAQIRQLNKDSYQQYKNSDEALNRNSQTSRNELNQQDNSRASSKSKKTKVKNKKTRDILRTELGIENPAPEVLPLDGIRASKKKPKSSSRGSLTEALENELNIENPASQVLPLDGVRPSKKKPKSDSLNNATGAGSGSLVEKAIKDTIESQRKQDQEAITRQQELDQSRNQEARIREQNLENASTLNSDAGEKVQLRFEAKREAVNRKRNDNRADLVEQYNKLGIDRNQAIANNDIETANNYAERMNAVTDLIAQNEKLRESELQILEIQKAQAAVISQRKEQDSRVDGVRSRRDAKLKEDENQKISDLQNQRSSLKDPVAIAAVNRNINQGRAEFRRDQENNKIADKTNDLSLNESRLRENRQLGISDPKLEAIDFRRERQGLTDRRQKTEGAFSLQNQAAENTFQSTVNTEAKKTQGEADKTDYSEKINKLRSELTNATNESLKVRIKFQIDQGEIEENYRKIESVLVSRLTGLRERRTALENAGQPSGELNGQMEQTQKQIEEARINKAEALRLLTENSLIKAGVAEFTQARNRTQANSLLNKPTIALDKRLASNLLEQGQNLQASVPGRSAALAEEQSRYQSERSNFQLGAEKAKAGGVDIPQKDLDAGLAAIDRLNALNIEGITQKFNNLAGSITASNLQLRNIAQGQATSFLADLIGGVDTFDKTWKKAAKGVVDGMIQILAQKFSATLTDGAGGKGSGGGLLSQGISFISKILGFNDGGVIDGQSHEFLANGNNPIAKALQREGAGGTVVVGKQGERILNLNETAKYHALYPNGIMNADRGGIIGGGGNTNIQNGGYSQSNGAISGKFAVDLSTNGQPQPTANEYLSGKLTQAMRAVILEESRENGIIDRIIRR